MLARCTAALALAGSAAAFAPMMSIDASRREIVQVQLFKNRSDSKHGLKLHASRASKHLLCAGWCCHRHCGPTSALQACRSLQFPPGFPWGCAGKATTAQGALKSICVSQLSFQLTWLARATL